MLELASKISKEIIALEHKMKDISPAAWKTYCKIEELESQYDNVVLGEIRRRLKSVLPQAYWPLLALAVTSETGAWAEFAAETPDSIPEYIRLDFVAMAHDDEAS